MSLSTSHLSSPDSIVDDVDIFVPKKKVARTFGKTTIMVYPDLDDSMSPNERSYAFTINKQALENARGIPYDHKLNIIGELMSKSTSINIEKTAYLTHSYAFLKDNDNLTVLGYYTQAGTMLPNALDANGDLKPVVDGAIANCRPNDIFFVKVSASVDLTLVNPSTTKRIPIQFFIRLPTSDQQVLNVNGVARTLHTFAGPSDYISGGTQDVYLALIYDHADAISSPFDLLPPSFSNPNASPHFESKVATFEESLFREVFDAICSKVLRQVCPTYIADPYSSLNRVIQTRTVNGKEHKLSVEAYFTLAHSILMTFDHSARSWPSNPFRLFVANLDPYIRAKMESNGFKSHQRPVADSPRSQMDHITAAYSAAITAESELAQQQALIHKTVSASHSFLSMPTKPNPDAAHQATTNLSSAEQTIKRYSQEEVPSDKCWGCGSSQHRYWDPVAKQVSCPRAAEPEVQARAAAVRKKYKEMMKSRRGRRSRGTRGTIKDLQEQVKTLTNKIDSRQHPASTGHVTLVTIPVLIANNNKEQLPIQIYPTLPHINLTLGLPSSTFQPTIACIVDTGSALCTGNSEYIMAIAKAYPELVKSITLAEDRYSPITLSGVIASDSDAGNDSYTTNLPAVVEFHMPYLTHYGTPTSLKIATGKDVGVNCLLGMSFLKAASMAIDLSDDVLQSKLLDHPPFAVVMRKPICGAPNIVPRNHEGATALPIVATIHKAIAFINKAYEDSTSPSLPIRKRCKITAPEDHPNPNPEITDSTHPHDIIRVPSRQKGKKRQSTYSYHDDNEIDINSGFEFLHAETTGSSIRKSSRPPRSDKDCDPAFTRVAYNESTHGEFLNKNLHIGPNVPAAIRHQLIALIQEFWCCFHEDNVKIPIQGYECVIETGNAKPCVAKHIRYGLHETPVMQKAIDSLLEQGMISPNLTSPWLSKCTLAPKPHQEDVSDIKDFVWRFCINYIALNAVTKVYSYFIPRCDDAVEFAFGNAKYFILLDAWSGYHQVRMEPSSRDKTAFGGPRGRKYVYNVMPFGIINAPTVYTSIIYDLREDWNHEARTIHNLRVDDSNNTTIIIDDTFGFGETHQGLLTYLRAILTIARRHSLTWKLKKCFFFPERVEFIGHDITHKGNHPSQSKTPLLQRWPQPKIVRDISSFLGFANFWSQYIPLYEQRIPELRRLIRDHGYDDDITKHWTSTAQNEFDDIKRSLLSEPLLQRVSRTKRCYLMTDFSAVGMGYVLAQPGDDEPSLAAMKREDAGGACEFDLTKSGLRLFSCAFGSRKCQSNETFLHSYVGEAKAMQFGIHKNAHILYGRPFTHIGDCRGCKFILSYDGPNHVIKRLQLEFMGWWMTLVHRNRNMNEAANYFSYLGADLEYDPLLSQYLKLTDDHRRRHPPAASGNTPLPENLPGFRGKRTTSPSAPSHLSTTSDPSSVAPITNIPIVFLAHQSLTPRKSLHHTACCHAAFQLLHQRWIVYGFSSGHFFSNARSLPERVIIPIAVDSTAIGRSFLQSYANTPTILSDAHQLLRLVKSDTKLRLQGYFITFPNESVTLRQTKFIQLQVTIIHTMASNNHLQAFIATIPRTYHASTIQRMRSALPEWSITTDVIDFRSMNDCIDGSTTVLIGIHTGLTGKQETITILRPPTIPISLDHNIHTPFDNCKHQMSGLPHEDDESKNDAFVIQPLSQNQHECTHHSRLLHYMLHKNRQTRSLAGAKVFDRHGLAPPLDLPNFNPFGRLFGITFQDEHKHTRTRLISPYEYCQCWGVAPTLIPSFAAQVTNLELLDAAIPANTSRAILDAAFDKLTQIKFNNCELTDSSASAAPAATAISYLQGATGTRLPNPKVWHDAYLADDETHLIIDMVTKPQLITTENLTKIHHVYRQPLRNSLILYIDDMLFIREPIDINENFIQLQIVPSPLRNIIFTAFHANPAGNHLDAYHTFHKIRLRYFWPHMWKHITHLIASCPGCRLAKSTIRRSSTLVYSFPIDQPWLVIHADVYTVGTELNFDGEKSFMTMLCGMCGFAASEPLYKDDINSDGFAKAIMKKCLELGLPHTIIVDKDSKFRKTFEDTMHLLQINLHVASGGNHNAILNENFHRYCNRSLRLFCNERDTNRVTAEGMKLLTYAWNSAPVTGTDISRSLVCLGREFKFPIEYANNAHINLSPDASAVQSFADVQQIALKQSREIFKILIHEHRAMHREYINSRRPDPLIYELNDLVFAIRSVQSDRKKGRVGKTQIKSTGPWRIIEKLKGSSYRIQHCQTHKEDKKHAAHLSPFPTELLPLPPLSGPDTSFSQIHRQIKKNPFQAASIQSYQPSLWPAAQDIPKSLFAFVRPSHDDVHFPSLVELNAEINSELLDPILLHNINQNPHISDIIIHEVLATTSQKERKADSGPICLSNLPPPSTESTFNTQELIISIIKSTDRLLFISHSLPNHDRREWQLVQVDWTKTMDDNPKALIDGRLYVHFLTSHPEDRQFSPPNQRYWTKYHKYIDQHLHLADYHVIRPTANRDSYTKQKHLIPYGEWITITDHNLIHGPFDFAHLQGRRTSDRISIDDWAHLAKSHHKYDNPAPIIGPTLITYSYHVDTPFHSTHRNPTPTPSP